MKVKVKGNPIVSSIGSLTHGVIYDLPDHVALHLMEIGSADPLQTKVMVQAEKKSVAITNASLSLPAAQALQKKTSEKPKASKPSRSTPTTK
jgi:hypothetical protein